MKNFNCYFFFLFLIPFLWGCGSSRQTSALQLNDPQEGYYNFLIDSILEFGLDHEALYTLTTDIKPMSSLVSFSFPIANTDTVSSLKSDIVDRNELGYELDRLYEIQQAVNKISLPDLKFVMVPYNASYKKDRIMQINVIRISKLDSLLRAREDFFGQFGLVPGADPAVVVSTIEFNDRYERLRGYGYLFGYPDHAIDFFAEASYKHDTNGEFVERNFFQIPTHTRDGGYFVYAYPKSYEPSVEVDSVIYYRAVNALDEYRKVRNNWLNPDSTLRSYDLLKNILINGK